MTPEERAEKSAAAMWDNDKASKWVGMAITNVDEGVATLELQVQDHHCNGHGICHGGVRMGGILTLRWHTFLQREGDIQGEHAR